MMNRREFLKKLAIFAGGIATAVVVPGALLAKPKPIKNGVRVSTSPAEFKVECYGQGGAGGSSSRFHRNRIEDNIRRSLEYNHRVFKNTMMEVYPNSQI